jgi:hypothetical protein
MRVTIVYDLMVIKDAWCAVEDRIRGVSVASGRPGGAKLACATLVCCAVVAGCGASGSGGSARRHISASARVCAGAQRAARPLLGSSVKLHIADSNPTDIECVLDGNAVHVDAIAQASAVAWTEYDTAAVHQAQAYGSGSLHDRSEQPHAVPGMAGNSTWIPAKGELIATNGTQSRGGSYLTVTVTRHAHHSPSSVTVAAAIARTMLASAPRGPNPGPPPS